MHRFIRRGLSLLLGLVLAVASLFGLSRLTGATDEQHAALALMQPSPMPAGRNAFPALWLMPYAVPSDQHEAITQEDAARIATWVAGAPFEQVGNGNPDVVRSVAAGRFPMALSASADADAPDYCQLRAGNCLDKVRSGLDDYGAMLRREAALINRLQALSGYDYIRMPPDHPAATLHMIPDYGLAGMLHTQHAFDFAEGRTDVALEGACTQVATWRRLGNSADTLIASMIGAAMVSGGVELFAQMLAELPPQHPLPAVCATAFAPVQIEDALLCEAMRGELAYGRAMTEAVWPRGSPAAAVGAWLLHHEANTHALLAANLAPACAPQIAEAIRRDAPISATAPEQSPWRLECVANAIGCMLADIAAPAYADYFHRRQDMTAELRLGAALLQLRERAGDTRPLRDRLAALPATIGSPTRPIEENSDGSMLQIRMFHDRYGPTRQVPLPPALRDGAADAATHTHQSTGSHSAK